MAARFRFDCAKNVGGASSLYSLSCRASRPAAAGLDRADIIMTSGAFHPGKQPAAPDRKAFSVKFSSTFSIFAIYFLVELSGDAPIFSPPRLKVVVQQQDAYGLSSNVSGPFSFDRLLDTHPTVQRARPSGGSL